MSLSIGPMISASLLATFLAIIPASGFAGPRQAPVASADAIARGPSPLLTNSMRGKANATASKARLVSIELGRAQQGHRADAPKLQKKYLKTVAQYAKQRAKMQAVGVTAAPNDHEPPREAMKLAQAWTIAKAEVKLARRTYDRHAKGIAHEIATFPTDEDPEVANQQLNAYSEEVTHARANVVKAKANVKAIRSAVTGTPPPASASTNKTASARQPVSSAK